MGSREAADKGRGKKRWRIAGAQGAQPPADGPEPAASPPPAVPGDAAGPAGKKPGGMLGDMGDVVRRLWALALVALFAELGYAILNAAAIPFYLRDEAHATESEVGLVIFVFVATETLVKAYLGHYGDTHGRKPLIVVGPLVASITPLIMRAVHQWVWFIPIRAVDGLAAACLWPNVFATVAALTSGEKRVAAMSLFNMTYLMGIALGLPIYSLVYSLDEVAHPPIRVVHTVVVPGPAHRSRWRDSLRRVERPLSRLDRELKGHVPGALRRLGHQAGRFSRGAGRRVLHFITLIPRPHHGVVFLTLSAVFFIAALLAYFFVPNTHGEPPLDDTGQPVLQEPMGWSRALALAKANPILLLMMLTALLQTVGITLLQGPISFYAKDELHLSEGQVGLVFLGPAVVVALLAVPLGWVAGRWGKVRSVRVGLAVAAISIWLIPASPSLLWVTIVAVPLVVGFLMATPSWLTLVTEMAPQGRAGIVVGVMATAQGVGASLGPLVGLPLYQWHHTWPFYASGTFFSAACILAWRYFREGVRVNLDLE